VYALVRQVPKGTVITYGAIARVLGEPGKAREVGWAMAVISDETIPAHRVINAQGKVSGGGHAALRRKQLEADGVVFQQDGRVDLDVYLWLPDAAGSGSGATPGE
jgi:methylated-DNA-protein-cysteine methyltransferase-like protein